MATFTGDPDFDPTLLDAINRGSAATIGSGALNGHLANCEPGMEAANYNEPGSFYGNGITMQQEVDETDG